MCVCVCVGSYVYNGYVNRMVVTRGSMWITEPFETEFIRVPGSVEVQPNIYEYAITQKDSKSTVLISGHTAGGRGLPNTVIILPVMCDPYYMNSDSDHRVVVTRVQCGQQNRLKLNSSESQEV
jgi:hypothetical protein